MPKKESQEIRAKKNMKLFNISYEDALQMVKDDDLIDAGGTAGWEKEMTEEQKKLAKKARMADRTITTEKTKRIRTEDPDRHELMVALENLIDEIGEKRVTLSEDREFEFFFHRRKYRLTIAVPRGKKSK